MTTPEPTREPWLIESVIADLSIMDGLSVRNQLVVMDAIYYLQRLRSPSPGVFGRTDLPQVMVYTAQIQSDTSLGFGYHQMVMFAEHQRALDSALSRVSQPSSGGG